MTDTPPNATPQQPQNQQPYSERPPLTLAEQVAMNQQQAQAQDIELAGRRPNGKIIAIVIAAAAIVIAAIIAFSILKGNAEADRLAHQQYPVAVNVNIEGYDPNTSTPVPMSISGTDFEGNLVSESFLYTSPDSAITELSRGEYTLQVLASPINADGSMYALSAPATALLVTDAEAEEQLKSSGHADLIGSVSADKGVGTAEPVALTKVEPLFITDEMVANTVDRLAELGYEADKSNPFKEAALAARAKAEEEKAAAEAALLAQQIAYDDQYLSLSVPASWADHWTSDMKVAHSIQGGMIPNAFHYTFVNTSDPSESFEVQIEYGGCYLPSAAGWDDNGTQLGHYHSKNDGLSGSDYANVRSSIEVKEFS